MSVLAIMTAIILAIGALWVWHDRAFLRDVFGLIYGASVGGTNEIAEQWKSVSELDTKIDRFKQKPRPQKGRVVWSIYDDLPEPTEFAVFTECPDCGTYGLHGMRQPSGPPREMSVYESKLAEYHADQQLQAAREPDYEIRSFGGETIRRGYLGVPKPKRPHVESEKYDVVRLCDCGKEFGQK